MLSKKRSKLAFYNKILAPIGGIETWLYYVSNDLKKYHDITVFYDTADPIQIKRLVDNGIKCEHIGSQPAETFDILFKGYNGEPPIKAKKNVHLIHACFSEMPEYKFQRWSKTDAYIAVSTRAMDSFLELFPEEKDRISVLSNYVPVKQVSPTKKFTGKLRLVMASRLTAEKGLADVIKMVNELDNMHVDYTLDLFTVFPRIMHLTNGKVKFVQPRLDIDFSQYHYLVQLSSSESYCYSVHEALSAGTAVITKDLPVFKNIVKHGYNGYIYPDISKIADVPVKFDYIPTGSVDDWLKYIENVV